MPAQQFLGELDALRMRRAGRHRARIDRKQIASGRQHVAPSAIGRTRRARRNALARQRIDQSTTFLGAALAATEDMQAVAELALLHVADKTVDPRDRFRRRGGRGQAKIMLDAGGTRFAADRGDETLAPRRIEAVGGRIFVEQLFEPDQVLRHRASGERRRQMSDRDRADAPLGLRRFAGIVDDERIDHRRPPVSASGQHDSDSATDLPGSHSSVPCAPIWIIACTPSLRSHR